MKQFLFILMALVVTAHLALYATNPAPIPRARALPRDAVKETSYSYDKDKDAPLQIAYKNVPEFQPPFWALIRWDTVGYVTLALVAGTFAGRIWPHRKIA